MATKDLFNLQIFSDADIVMDIVDYVEGNDNPCHTLTDYYAEYKRICRASLTDLKLFMQLQKYKDYYL